MEHKRPHPSYPRQANCLPPSPFSNEGKSAWLVGNIIVQWQHNPSQVVIHPPSLSQHGQKYLSISLPISTRLSLWRQGQPRNRYCYIMVDFWTAATQKDLVLLSFSFIRKQFYKEYGKKRFYFIIMFIFYHWAIVKQDHYMAHLLFYANTVLWCCRRKINRYIAAPRQYLYLFLYFTRFLAHLLKKFLFTPLPGSLSTIPAFLSPLSSR